MKENDTNILRLPWDSDFFDLRVGKLEVTSAEEISTSRFFTEASQNYDLIYVIAADHPLGKEVIQSCDLELMEIMIQMSKPFEFGEPVSDDILVNNLKETELQECYHVAEQTSIVSRFFHEPLVGAGKTREMYRKWVDNALAGVFSDGIFYHKIDNEIIGIHLIKTDEANGIGKFTLTGIDGRYLGKNIGKLLWEKSYSYWHRNFNIHTVISTFSFFNRASFNFHLKMGFNRITEIRYIYHYRNSQRLTL